MITEESIDLKGTLKEVFGYNTFRGNQEEIIRNILGGQNTFVIMPTGAGKSMCYQLPAVVKDGTAIVISPLIALMKNQVDQLNALGVKADFLNSTLSKGEITRVKQAVLDGETKLLYVAPESLTKEDNINFLKNAKLSFVAVDEAHCISEWGHDFRPEYRRIKDIIEQIENLPIIALTATATPKVKQDIVKNLKMDDAGVFKSSFNRVNLYYEVRPKVHAKKNIIKFIKDNKGKSGIIYCLSRKKVEEIAELLTVNGIKAAPYHAGLEASVRNRHQDQFLNEELDVIVATIAFGMGIDKPDIRFVIHYDAPKSLEGYYQETGRAGRDGLEGKCLMFYRDSDLTKLEKFHKDKTVQERENAKILLQEVAAYAESAVCRRKQLLHYFGEGYDESECIKSGKCDNCTHERESFEAREAVQIALDGVLQTQERFPNDHIINVIRGFETEYVKSYGHDQLEVFGKGSSEDAGYWKSVFRQSLLNDFVRKDIDNVGVMKITPKGEEFLAKPHNISFRKDLNYMEMQEEDEGDNMQNNTHAYDEDLFQMLRNLRKNVARHKNFPPYVIFQDPSLEEMATTYPTTEEELAQINGVGIGKVKKFGKDFIELIKEYVDEHDITTAADVVVKSAVNKSKIKIYIIQAIDRKLDLEEIAENKDISMESVITEIENICLSGTKLNLEYYIDQVLDHDKQDDLYDYFLNADTDDITVALDDDDNADYSEEEIRLMRIKFLSEYAN